MRYDLWFPLLIAWLVCLSSGDAQEDTQEPASRSLVGGVNVTEVLQTLGARMEQGATPEQLRGYYQHFDRLDGNRDGNHSQSEYIENGNYLTPQSRRGIFNASDTDRDGSVSRAEYVLNRLITDEAKTIMQSMDQNRNGSIEMAEFTQGAELEDDLGVLVFQRLDVNSNGSLVVPEYLRVWGQWAREGRPSPEERLSILRNPRSSVQGGRGWLKFDTDQDGQLQAREFLAMFRKADRNKDGALDREELNLLPSSENHKGDPRRRR